MVRSDNFEHDHTIHIKLYAYITFNIVIIVNSKNEKTPGRTVPSTSAMELYHTHTSLSLFHRSATLTMMLSSWFHSTGQKYAQLASSKNNKYLDT